MPEDARPRLDPTDGLPHWLHFAWLAAMGALLVSFRAHGFELPLENDEGNYAYIGSRLLAGDKLYVDVWDHQPFGVFALFAGVIALFGDNPLVFRWLATTFSIASLVLIYGITFRLGGRLPAMLAALLFALASADPGTAGEGCNREIYMNTLILGAWYAAMPGRSAWFMRLLLAGTLLGVASTLKTIVAIHWAALALWTTLHAFGAFGSHRRWRSAAAALLLIGAGPAVIWAVTSLYYFLTDRWPLFIEAVFTFNLSYSEDARAFGARFITFFNPPRHPFIFDSAWPLWIGGAIGGLWLLARSAGQAAGWSAWRQPRHEDHHDHQPEHDEDDEEASRASAPARDRAHGLLIVLLIVAGYVAVCLPARFWPHYYYLLIPTLAISAALAIGGLVAALTGSRGVTLISHGSPARRLGAMALYTLLPGFLLYTQYRDYIAQPPFGITVKRYNSRDFWARAQGENVRRVTDPEDTVFVYGNDAAIYYYAQRRCASRFTMITGLAEGSPNVESRREALLADLRTSQPRVIVVLFDQPPFPGWESFLRTWYTEPIGWDRHDQTGQPIMFVVTRRDHPVEQIDWEWDRASVNGWHLNP